MVSLHGIALRPVVVYGGYIHWTTNRSLHTGRRSSTAANRSTINHLIRSSRPVWTHPTHECRSTATAPIDAEQRRAESHIAAFKKHE